ncbi:MAG: hypothetical protein J2P18_21300, partial [Nocardia sp.]|nr:hypothetical protein [Nocardia sp.]
MSEDTTKNENSESKEPAQTSEAGAEATSETRAEAASEPPPAGDAASADESDTSTDTKSAADEQVSQPAKASRSRVLITTAAALAVLLIAAIGTSVYYYLQNRDARQLAGARDQARTAACAYAPVLADYDAKNLDSYFKNVLDGATGEWHTQFESTTPDLRDALTKAGVTSKVTDVQCAVQSNDRNSAVAVVVIGQSVTSQGTGGKPVPGQLSMVLRMQKQG